MYTLESRKVWLFLNPEYKIYFLQARQIRKLYTERQHHRRFSVTSSKKRIRPGGGSERSAYMLRLLIAPIGHLQWRNYRERTLANALHHITLRRMRGDFAVSLCSVSVSFFSYRLPSFICACIYVRLSFFMSFLMISRLFMDDLFSYKLIYIHTIFTSNQSIRN